MFISIVQNNCIRNTKRNLLGDFFSPKFEIFFSAQKGCKCTYNLFALKWKVHCFYINFSKIWNNSWFRQNLGVILFQIMYLDHKYPLMQKSYFGQNVTYNLFALRWRFTGGFAGALYGGLLCSFSMIHSVLSLSRARCIYGRICWCSVRWTTLRLFYYSFSLISL